MSNGANKTHNNGKSYDELFKLIIVGDSCVGKTSILQRFHGEHFPMVAVPTIGIDFRIRTITIQNKVIKLQIWDTSGQEKYDSITTSYYRGAMGVLLVYDITNRKSYEHIKNRWVKHLQQNIKAGTPIALLGNKCDMESKREVSRDTGDALAIDFSYRFLETSAKENTNLEKAFYDIANDIFLKNNGSTNEKIGESLASTVEREKRNSKYRCCQITISI